MAGKIIYYVRQLPTTGKWTVAKNGKPLFKHGWKDFGVAQAVADRLNQEVVNATGILAGTLHEGQQHLAKVCAMLKVMFDIAGAENLRPPSGSEDWQGILDAVTIYQVQTVPEAMTARIDLIEMAGKMAQGWRDAVPPAFLAVADERVRQIHGEGFSPSHDDKYTAGDLARAAACYARAAAHPGPVTKDMGVPDDWPWPEHWWRPASRRRCLEKAGALIVAEIERLERAEEASRKWDAAIAAKTETVQ